MIKVVIFDFDGVVVDSIPTHYKAFKKVLGEVGADFTWKDYEAYIASGPVRIIETFAKGQDVQKLIDRKNEIIESMKVELVDGLLDLCSALIKGGFRLAIASGGTRSFVEDRIKRLNIGSRFDAAVTMNDVPSGRHKPFPDVFLKAAERLGVKPADCLVVEDAEAGVNAAINAKMKVIALVNPHYPDQDLSKADLVVKSLREVTIEKIKKL